VWSDDTIFWVTGEEEVQTHENDNSHITKMMQLHGINFSLAMAQWALQEIDAAYKLSSHVESSINPIKHSNSRATTKP